MIFVMNLTHIEGKSVVVNRFIKTLKGTICKQLVANDSKSFLGYLNRYLSPFYW